MNCKSDQPENDFSKHRNVGFISLANIFSDTAKKIVGKNGFMELDIITAWNEIVGKDLAEYTYPQHIDFEKKEKNNGILNICADNGAVALEISHRKKSIIEKINTFFGYSAIADLKIIQVQFYKQETTKFTSHKKSVVTLKEQNYIDEQTANVKNENLQQILIKLGKNILG